jgi:outer membrane receptor protein involved in Fe transport
MQRIGLPLALVTAGLATASFAADPYVTDGMVVTGTRQAEDIRDLAGNTAQVDAQRIQQVAPERPAEVLNQLPGVNIQQGSGEEHLSAIRSPVLNGGEGAGSFLILEDGVPLRAAGFGNVNGLYEANIEQAGGVEVVRGPGSALYGSNALHGLINIIPMAPAKSFGGDTELIVGTYGLRQVMGSVTGDDFRLSAEDHHEDGWRVHTGMDEQKSVLRQVWTGQDDTVTTTVSGQHLDQSTGGYIGGANSYKNRAIAESNPEQEAFRRADSVRAMSRWQHDLSDDLQLSLTPYTRHTEMAFIQHYLPDKALEKDSHASGGMQSALYYSLPGGHSIILGTDAEFTAGSVYETQSNPSLVSSGYLKGVHYNYDAEAVVLAPYLHSEWQLPARTKLTAGVRFEDTTYDYYNHGATGVYGRFLRIGDRSDNFNTVTPKLGLSHQWDDRLASYVNLSEGSRAPQVSELYSLQSHQVPGEIKSEVLDSLEVGSRGNVGGVKGELVGYWMVKKNGFYRDADGYNMTDAVTWHRGVELDLSAPLPGHFDIGTAATYALHTYEFNRPVATLLSPTDAVSKSNEVAEAPRTLANLRLGYTFAQGVRAEAEWVHVGPYFMDSANEHRYPGHELLNLRANAALTEAVSVDAKVLNATNAAYATRATFANNAYQYFPGDPLTIIGGVRVKF